MCVILRYFLQLSVAMSFVITLPTITIPATQYEMLPRPQRIINGQEVFVYDYPYLVYFEIATTNQILCGGTIVNRWSILTAGHCVFQRQLDEIIVIAGYNKESRDMQFRDIIGVKMHPQFVYQTRANATPMHIDYDYAIVHIHEPLKYTLGVRWVTLSQTMDDLNLNDAMFVMGWGGGKPKSSNRDDAEGMTKGAPLLKVGLNLDSFGLCQKNYSNIGISVTERFFCASSKQGSTCHGDSGGPIVVGALQYGLVSFAAGCFRDGYPTVFANIPVVYDWIMKAARAAMMIHRGEFIYFIIAFFVVLL